MNCIALRKFFLHCWIYKKILLSKCRQTYAFYHYMLVCIYQCNLQGMEHEMISIRNCMKMTLMIVMSLQIKDQSCQLLMRPSRSPILPLTLRIDDKYSKLLFFFLCEKRLGSPDVRSLHSYKKECSPRTHTEIPQWKTVHLNIILTCLHHVDLSICLLIVIKNLTFSFESFIFFCLFIKKKKFKKKQ